MTFAKMLKLEHTTLYSGVIYSVFTLPWMKLSLISSFHCNDYELLYHQAPHWLKFHVSKCQKYLIQFSHLR